VFKDSGQATEAIAVWARHRPWETWAEEKGRASLTERGLANCGLDYELRTTFTFFKGWKEKKMAIEKEGDDDYVLNY
jgi:hypothetical protein